MYQESIKEEINQTLEKVENAIIMKAPLPNESILFELINKIDSFWYRGILNYIVASPIYKHYPNFTLSLIEKINPTDIQEHLSHILNKLSAQPESQYILEKLYSIVSQEYKKDIIEEMQYLPLYKVFIECDFNLDKHKDSLHFIKKEKIKLSKKILESFDPYSFYHADTVEILKNRLNTHYELLSHFHHFKLENYFKTMKNNIPVGYEPEKIKKFNEFHQILDNFYDSKVAQKEKEQLEKSLSFNQHLHKKQKI